jgi:hypothetical protein
MFKTHLYNENVVFYHIKGAGRRTLYATNPRNNHETTIIRKFKEVAGEVMRQLPYQKA